MVPSRNTPTRDNPSINLQPEKGIKKRKKPAKKRKKPG
jgi:hypothetical protein